MKTISRYIMTLALLLTAVTGAWAADTYTVAGNNSDMFGSAWDPTNTANDMTKNGDGTYSITYTNVNLDDNVQYKVVKNHSWNEAYPDGDRVITIAEAGTYTVTIHFNPTTHEVYETMPGSGSGEPDVEVTTNAASEQDLFTEASFKMPTFDATVNYMLVRDLMDDDTENAVHFTGLPANGTTPIVVKKGSDGKYQPIEALNIQLIDPLATAEAQNIIAADGITVKVLVGDDSSLPIEYDHYSPITLEAFLADMKPGYYWITAESTDENSPYDGTAFSSQFTVVEQYDLTVKPANDFSKGKIESVTVGSGSVTIDANTGKATKEGIDPGTEVKVKAKRGYVIDKVEVKKDVPAEGHDLTASAVGDIVGSDGKTYAAADKDNLPKNVTAVAMVAYKNGTGGLAIALSDEGSMNFSTAKSTCASKTAISGATWQLPSKNQWGQIFSANGGNNNSYTGLNTAIDNAGGTALVAGNVYWSTSSAPVSGSYYCIMINNGGSIGSQIGSSGKNKMTRAILTF